jgi:hypothetical protein
LFPIVVLPSVALRLEIRAGSGQTEAIHHRLVGTGAVFLRMVPNASLETTFVQWERDPNVEE